MNTIVDVVVRSVPLDLVEPLRTSSGVHLSRTAVLVGVVLGDGTTGWGEDVAPVGDFYTGETATASMRHLVDVLVPRWRGATFTDASDFEMRVGDDGFPMARHALSSAVWDAWCRSCGIPLAEALGGSVRDVEVGAVVGIGDDIDATVGQCRRRVAEGYRHLKVKIAPGRDVAVLAAVREAVGAGPSLSVDGNGAYSRSDIPTLVRLSEAGVALVEQPFARDDLASHAALVAETSLLVGLDESIMSPDDLRRALDARACTAVNVKPSRLGGFAASLEVLGMCQSAGIDAWVGGMLESGIGRAGALALASHPGCTLPADLSASDRYFTRGVCEPFVLVGGRLSPRGPGIGVSPIGSLADDGGR